MKLAIKIVGAALVALGTAGCVGSALPPNTLVQAGPGLLPPPPPAYGPPPPAYLPPPPPPRRCFFRDGPFGPERVCRGPYY